MKRSYRIMSVLTASAIAFAFAFSVIPAHAMTSGITKDETVYVVTDASGTKTDVVVSDHLMNKDETDTIVDNSDLKNIENVKGDETFKKGEKDQIVWNAEGNDIYYEGTTDRETPVTLDITYKLNGREIDGEELKGKSGDVEIKIDYKNSAKATEGGKNITVPFIAMTGFVADEENFTDVEIDNGKVIDDGNRLIVVGLAAPGVTDALNIDTSKYDIDLKDSITIKAKAKKFNIQDMMTVVTNSVFEDVDVSDMKLDFDDEVNALEEGAGALVDGSSQLYRGMDSLNGNMPALENGVYTLSTGAGRLKTGSIQLRDGSKKILDSMTEAKIGVDQMKTGIDGNGTLANPGAIPALGQISTGLKASANTLRAKATQMEEAEKDAAAIAEYMKDVNGLVKKYESELRALDYGDLVDKTPTINNDAQQLEACLCTPPGFSGQLRAAADLLYKEGDVKSAGVATSQVAEGLKQVSAGLGQLSSSLGGYEPKKGSKQDTLIGGQTVLYNGGKSLAGGASQLASGMRSLEQNTEKLSSGVDKLDRGALELNRGMKKFYSEGIKALVDLYRNNLKGSVDSLRDMMEAGSDYKTFTKLPDDMDGSVKFIYKTTVYK